MTLVFLFEGPLMISNYGIFCKSFA